MRNIFKRKTVKNVVEIVPLTTQEKIHLNMLRVQLMELKEKRQSTISLFKMYYNSCTEKNFFSRIIYAIKTTSFTEKEYALTILSLETEIKELSKRDTGVTDCPKHEETVENKTVEQQETKEQNQTKDNETTEPDNVNVKEFADYLFTIKGQEYDDYVNKVKTTWQELSSKENKTANEVRKMNRLENMVWIIKILTDAKNMSIENIKLKEIMNQIVAEKNEMMNKMQQQGQYIPNNMAANPMNEIMFRKERSVNNQQIQQPVNFSNQVQN